MKAGRRSGPGRARWAPGAPGAMAARRAPLALLLGLSLCACDSLAPRYERPEFEGWRDRPFAHDRGAAPEAAAGAPAAGGAQGQLAAAPGPAAQGGAAAEGGAGAEPAGQSGPRLDLARWWTRLGDPELEALVAEAFAHNPDALALAERVEAARAEAAVARGGRWPTIGLDLNATRSRVELDNGNAYASITSPGASISWQADLFGELRSAARAATARFAASERQQRALLHSLAAEVVRARADLSTLERRLRLARQVLASRSRTEETVARRFEAGVPGVAAVDVFLARENRLAAEAALPALERARDERALALERLLGRPAGSGPAPRELAELPPPPAPAAGLPAALLDGRPDLQAAELNAIAANHQVGVALARLYPDLTLSGQASRGINAAGGAFQIEGWVAAATAGLSTTLFAGGALRAASKAEQARARQALQEYSALVLNAFVEVESALIAERRLAEQLERVSAQAAAARAAETAARGRYEQGLESLLVLLDTQRRRAQAEDLAAGLTGEAWSARIDLILAVGGEWLPPAASDIQQAQP